MKQIFSIAAYRDGLTEYRDSQDLRSAYEAMGVEGLEVIFCGGGYEDKISYDMIHGVHLCFFPLWIDYWKQNEQALLDEMGSRELYEGFYGGSLENARQNYLSWFERDLDEAEQVGAEYVVFHVSEVTIGGVYTGRHLHGDEEVVDAAAEVINLLMAKRKDASFTFLVENLQHPGLNMQNPAVTKRLLDQIEYKNKGIMLDTGHFMGVNRNVHSEAEGCRLIHAMLDAHEELLPYFKGMHLHSGVMRTGFPGFLQEDPTAGRFYYDRFSEVYRFLDQIDPHRPFQETCIAGVIDRIQPRWLVHELLPGKGREERLLAVKYQSGIIEKNCKKRYFDLL